VLTQFFKFQLKHLQVKQLKKQGINIFGHDSEAYSQASAPFMRGTPGTI